MQFQGMIAEYERAQILERSRRGKRHRARAGEIFVFDANTRLLLQRRARGKYHSGGLWSNACCSHPHPGESLLDSAHRRLRDEMGFNCPLEAVFGFVYRATLDGGLVEHEFDHALVGRFQGTPVPNACEVEDWKWESLPAVRSRYADNPLQISASFKTALDGLLVRGFPR